MNPPKVLIIQDELKNYRDPIYALIGKQVDLTVGYTKSTDVKESSYPIIPLPYRKIGPFSWHIGLRRTINEYDVIVYAPFFRMPRVSLMPFLPHKPKLISWSLGVHASYTRPYDLTKKPDFQDWLYESIQDHSDACVFYMPEPIEYWNQYKGIDKRKYFVARNTVAVATYEKPDFSERELILFVGTLYKQKGLEELLDCYAIAKDKVGKLPTLIIVGDGPEKDNIEQHIKERHLEDAVELIGAIYDENLLRDYFLKSIVCVSPKQAGLSVLKSLGYGVPFVTRENAITGGEKSNIINGQTGYLYNTKEELIDVLIKTATRPEVFAAMSEAARSHYLAMASPERMAQGVVDAILYVLNLNNN